MRVLPGLLGIFVFVVSSCVNPRVLHTEKYKGQDILVGEGNFRALMVAPYQKWFEENRAAYQPVQPVVEQLKPYLKDVEMEVFMGTWCPDSREHVPVFYKVLQAAGYDPDRVKVFFLPREYGSHPLVKGKNIIRVPTFVFYENGRELGRIIEYPMESVEKDMLKILTVSGYRHELENQN